MDNEQTVKYTQYHENDRAFLAIVHEPGLEVKFGSLHPIASLFEKGGSTRRSIKDHHHLVKALQDFGIEVQVVKKVLVQHRLDHLKNMALACVSYAFVDDISLLSPEELDLLRGPYKKDVIDKMDGSDLFDIVLTRPTVEMKKTAINTPVGIQNIRLSPVENLVFSRDQQIVTAKGLVLGHLNSDQRLPESVIMEHVWQSLGIPIIGKIEGSGRLEGGEFLPAGDLAFIGVGLRTNYEAVNYMLNGDMFGCDRVAVVVDQHDKNQERMHLDTVFNILDGNTVVLLETIAGDDKPIRRIVHEYKKNSQGKYEKQEKETEFSQFLTQNGFRIIPVSDKHQKEYMINYLNVGEGRILSVHPDLKQVLEAHNWKGTVKTIHYEGIERLYGAAHCTTQVFRTRSNHTANNNTKS